jgi:hypothetical protein
MRRARRKASRSPRAWSCRSTRSRRRSVGHREPIGQAFGRGNAGSDPSFGPSGFGQRFRPMVGRHHVGERDHNPRPAQYGLSYADRRHVRVVLVGRTPNPSGRATPAGSGPFCETVDELDRHDARSADGDGLCLVLWVRRRSKRRARPCQVGHAERDRALGEDVGGANRKRLVRQRECAEQCEHRGRVMPLKQELRPGSWILRRSPFDLTEQQPTRDRALKHVQPAAGRPRRCSLAKRATASSSRHVDSDRFRINGVTRSAPPTVPARGQRQVLPRCRVARSRKSPISRRGVSSAVRPSWPIGPEFRFVMTRVSRRRRRYGR